jgi:hypothetical protein
VKIRSPNVGMENLSLSPSPTPPPPKPKLPPTPSPSVPRYIVQFDYAPPADTTEEGMISISAGEMLTISDSSDPDWWRATKLSNGQSGWIPAAYVKLA